MKPIKIKKIKNAVVRNRDGVYAAATATNQHNNP